MIQLLGNVFGHDASTWNFGKSSAKAGAIDSAHTKSDGTNFMSSLPTPVIASTGVEPMLRFQPDSIKG